MCPSFSNSRIHTTDTFLIFLELTLTTVWAIYIKNVSWYVYSASLLCFVDSGKFLPGTRSWCEECDSLCGILFLATIFRDDMVLSLLILAR